MQTHPHSWCLYSGSHATVIMLRQCPALPGEIGEAFLKVVTLHLSLME